MKQPTKSQIGILCAVATGSVYGLYKDGVWIYPGYFRPDVEMLLAAGMLECEEYRGGDCFPCDRRGLFITLTGCAAVEIALDGWRREGLGRMG